ncbi:MAG: hypothetical protein AB1505_28035 [Candidatus Latescibacterota bacterium]
MPEGTYALMGASRVWAAAGETGGARRRLLEEFLRNPFLDDDALGLALRAGLSREEAQQGLAALCAEGYLKEAGRRGHMLDLGEIRPPGGAESLAAEPGPEPVGPAEGNGGPACGCILMRADGRLEMMDDQAARLLGVEARDFDAAAFEGLTGIDIGLVVGGGARLTFSLAEPRPLVVTLHACCLGNEPGVLIVLESGQAEVAAIHVQVQEEMFARLRGEMVEPILLIQQFLENPDPEGLGCARAALEQVNRFLDDYLLGGTPNAKA